MAPDHLLNGAVAVLEHAWWTAPASTFFLWGTCTDTVWLRGVLPKAPTGDPRCPWHGWRTGPGGALAIHTAGRATSLFLALMGHASAGRLAGFVLDQHRRQRLLVGSTLWHKGWTAVETDKDTLQGSLSGCPDDALALFQGFGCVPFQAFSSAHEQLLDAALLAEGHHAPR
jgi:hypothetical protein